MDDVLTKRYSVEATNPFSSSSGVFPQDLGIQHPLAVSAKANLNQYVEIHLIPMDPVA